MNHYPFFLRPLPKLTISSVQYNTNLTSNTKLSPEAPEAAAGSSTALWSCVGVSGARSEARTALSSCFFLGGLILEGLVKAMLIGGTGEVQMEEFIPLLLSSSVAGLWTPAGNGRLQSACCIAGLWSLATAAGGSMFSLSVMSEVGLTSMAEGDFSCRLGDAELMSLLAMVVVSLTGDNRLSGSNHEN